MLTLLLMQFWVKLSPLAQLGFATRTQCDAMRAVSQGSLCTCTICTKYSLYSEPATADQHADLVDNFGQRHSCLADPCGSLRSSTVAVSRTGGRLAVEMVPSQHALWHGAKRITTCIAHKCSANKEPWLGADTVQARATIFEVVELVVTFATMYGRCLLADASQEIRQPRCCLLQVIIKLWSFGPHKCRRRASFHCKLVTSHTWPFSSRP